MQKAIVYCRVSSERQKTEGHGLDSQEHRCRDYATQKGYEIEKVFRDSFSGGGDYTKRPAMSELLSYMDSKPYNKYVVIFDDLKRLARDTEQFIRLRKTFKLRSAIVDCPNFTFSDDPEGQYIETIMAATAQLEREQNRRQVMQKMKARLELGYWCFPDVPAGYKFIKDPVHGKLPVIVPEEAEIVKEALEGFATGRFMEQEDVRKFLEEKNMRNGKPVYLEYVKRLLTRIFVAGYIEYPEWEVSRRMAKHEPLIDLTTYERIQEKLSGKTTTFIKKILNDDFPLRGFVLCDECRQPVTGSWSTGRNGKFAYYRCKTKRCSQRNKSSKKDVVESEFKAILGKIKPTKKVLDFTKVAIGIVWKKKEGEIIKKKKVMEAELSKLEDERKILLDRVTRAVDEQLITAYETRISESSEKIVVLKNSIMSFQQHQPNIETALGIVFDFLENPLKRWVNGDIRTKKLVLSLVFEQKLVYSRKSGFETAFLSLPLRVFTFPEAQNELVVEMGGIEPPCSHCEYTFLQA
jgi:site-specific DNA recombinase